MEPTEVQSINHSTKLSHLDGLRGLAAFIVILHHFSLAFFPSIILGAAFAEHSSWEHYLTIFPLSLLTAGNFAVSIFFVLSGFVLTRSYFAKGDKLQIRLGALKRYVRLAIPVGVSVLLAYLLLRLGWFGNQQLVAVTGSTEWLVGQWNFAPHMASALKQAIYGSLMLNQSSYNSSLWTIYFELLGSFLAFGLAVFAKGAPQRYILYIGAAIITLQTWYLAFVIGVALADAWESPVARRLARRAAPLAPLLLFVGLVLGGYPQFGIPSSGLYAWMTTSILSTAVLSILFHNVGAGMVMAGVLSSKRIAMLLKTRPFQYLGFTSFSAYLLHVIVLCSFSSYLFRILVSNYSYMHSFAATLGVSIVLIYGASYLYAKYVDQPSIRLANGFAKLVMFGHIRFNRKRKRAAVTVAEGATV